MCWGKKYFSFLLLIVLFFIPDVSFASNGKAIDDRVKAQIGRLSIPFIENVGQVENNDVSFYAKTFGGTVFITKKGDIVYSLPESNKTKNISQGIIKNNTESVIAMNKTQKQSNIKSVIPSEARNLKAITSSSARNEDKTTPLRVIALKEELIGGSVTEVKGEGKSVTKVNYFKGNDPSKWRNNIPTHNLVSLGEVFSGIALKLKAYGNNVEKLFYIKPYANFEDIKLKLEGAKGIRINEKGELEVKTELGTVKFTKPIAYQEIDGKRVEVVVSYLIPQSEISNTQFEYGFKVGNYDRTKELVIDPLLASTFLGGSNYESGVFVSPLSQISMAIDKGRNIYLVGNTYSSDFPTTTGVHDTSFNSGYSDAIISKLNSNLTTLLASTFIGGSGWDDAESIAVDISGNVYVTGYTGSLDFPTTPGAYDTSFNGGSDAFVSKFNSNLTILLA
ncbi:MAG: hypothetical protein FJ241_05765, partial [Nitrospira sp.]|nr:hypothetical protein [Nitrospira sp.]